MEIYRTFTKQTDYVVQYCSVARQYEHHTRVEVPKLKHAPVNLGRQLEDYLKDPDFDVHRRQYLAELEAKKNKGSSGASSKPFKFETPSSKASTSTAFPDVNGSQSAAKAPETKKGPDADLIDFFDSIEQNQTTLGVQPTGQPGQQMGASPWGNTPFQQPQPTEFQQNGFAPQPTGMQGTNPFLQHSNGAFQQQQQQQQAPQPLQPAFTGAGFGGFTPQAQQGFQPSSLSAIPQDSVASFQTGMQQSMPNLLAPQQQTTNPFRQSMMMTGQTSMPTGGMGTQSAPISPPTLQPQPTSTNPFARSSPQAVQPFGAPNNNSPFPTSQPAQQHLSAAPAPLQAMATGTNPFAKNFGGAQQQQEQQQRPSTSAGALAPQPTGVTNPFRQGAFVNHNTGMGWQHNQQRMGGGLDQLETIPVFPRPTQQNPWQQ